ncbi:MAG: hypothetical protein C0404_00680 [Verrucomicrobia bacterium]|nr:hypothetical protein [Verrucomicrobiota bacterium]
MSSMANDEMMQRFVMLYSQHQRVIFNFVLAGVSDFHAAEDIVQNIGIVLWKKFDLYRPEMPFVRWALGVARLEVLQFHRRKGRSREDLVSEEIIDIVAASMERETDGLADESNALATCVDKLPQHHKDLIKMRYGEGAPIKDVAQQFGQTFAMANMSLVRIRKALLECVKQSMSKTAQS